MSGTTGDDDSNGGPGAHDHTTDDSNSHNNRGDHYTQHQNTTFLHSQGHSLIHLSRANTSKLLSAASQVQVSQQRHGEATAICSRLAELNPQVAKWFKPKQEALDHLDMRMLMTTRAPFADNTDNDNTTITSNSDSSGGVQGKQPSASIDSFIVISYCWHYPSWPLPGAARSISPGWEISRPMVNAVLSHRSSEAEGVWIDRLCINQADEADKTTHVGAMDLVYKSARRVIILLEDVQLDREEQYVGVLYRDWYMNMCREVKDQELEGEEKMAFVDGFVPRMEMEWAASGWRDGVFAERFEGMEGPGEQDRLRLFQGFGKRFAMKILSARWFERAWCAHESRVATHGKVDNPLVLCFGADVPSTVTSDDRQEKSTETTAEVVSFEFRFVHYISMYLSSLPADEPATIEALYDKLQTTRDLLSGMKQPDPMQLWQLWYRIQMLMPERSQTVSAMQHLGSILSFGCLHAGDLISIALNTGGVPLVFTGQREVRDVQDVVWIFTTLVLAMEDLVPLIADGAKLRGPKIGENEDDSWSVRKHNIERTPWENAVVSWAPSPNQGVMDDMLPIPDPSLITSVTKEYIELDMLLLTASPAAPSVEAQAKADKIIQDHGLEALAEVLAATADSAVTRKNKLMKLATDKIKKGEPGPLHVFVKVWLSFGIDCGRDWMLRFADNMRQATQGQEDSTGWTHGVLGGDEDSPVDEQLEAAARDLLACYEVERMKSEEGQNGESVALEAAQKSEANNKSQYTETDFRNTIRFLRIILDSRLKFFTTAPRVMPLNTSDYIVGVSTSNTAYYAIPLAVAHLPAWQKRGWIVEPFDPSAPPETLADMLPDPNRTNLKPDDLAVDVYPVLNSDAADCRKPWAENKGDWRLRRREEVFGCQNLDWNTIGDAFRDGVHAVVLKKQKIYGAEDYPWAEIMKAAQRLEATLKADEKGEIGEFKEQDARVEVKEVILD